jgi:hypothetical protein
MPKKRKETRKKQVVVADTLPVPLRAFSIPVNRAEIPLDQWNRRHHIMYGSPEGSTYKHPTSPGIVEFYAIPAYKDNVLLGYIPIPPRYLRPWRLLCYAIVQMSTMWKLWGDECQRQKAGARKNHMITIRQNAGARVTQYMVVRRMVIEELVEIGFDNPARVHKLDEFMIRYDRDWLFEEFEDVSREGALYLRADPLGKENKDLFGA